MGAVRIFQLSVVVCFCFIFVFEDQDVFLTLVIFLLTHRTQDLIFFILMLSSTISGSVCLVTGIMISVNKYFKSGEEVSKHSKDILTVVLCILQPYHSYTYFKCKKVVYLMGCFTYQLSSLIGIQWVVTTRCELGDSDVTLPPRGCCSSQDGHCF